MENPEAAAAEEREQRVVRRSNIITAAAAVVSLVIGGFSIRIANDATEQAKIGQFEAAKTRCIEALVGARDAEAEILAALDWNQIIDKRDLPLSEYSGDRAPVLRAVIGFSSRAYEVASFCRRFLGNDDRYLQALADEGVTSSDLIELNFSNPDFEPRIRWTGQWLNGAVRFVAGIQGLTYPEEGPEPPEYPPAGD